MRTIHGTRALNAGIDDPSKEWKRPCGRPRQTWLRTVENDLKQQNLGLWSARHRAYDREEWREIVEAATPLQGHAILCYALYKFTYHLLTYLLT